MFLDLNSSTAIAEKLGDEKYHELLKDFFADITNPILDSVLVLIVENSLHCSVLKILRRLVRFLKVKKIK